MIPSAKLRYLRNKREAKIGSHSQTITYTDTEAYALCHYIRILAQDKSNHTIMNEASEVIKCFLEFTVQLNKKEHLRAILQNEIRKLERQKRLTPLDKSDTAKETFDDFDIPYKYKEDKSVERYMNSFDSISGDIIVDIYRVLLANEKQVFSAIVNTAIFRNTKSLALVETCVYTKAQLAAICDITKTQFLVDQKILSKEEARYILMRCRLETINDLRSAYRAITSSSRDKSLKTAQMLNISDGELSKILRSDKNIKSFGFIDIDGDYNSNLNECIETGSIEPYFSELLKPLECGKAYNLKSFSTKTESKEICLDLLRGDNPVSILFYGKPGSGKTEMAKTLGKLSGKKVYIFKNEAETDDDVKVLNRLNCLLSMERPDSLIIIDEADSLLRGVALDSFGAHPLRQKGVVNKMLENNKGKAIYIINHKTQIDESTMRRFTFSVKFDAMPKATLKSIAMSKIAPLKIDRTTKEKLIGLFDAYRLTGSSVDNVVKTIQSMRIDDKEDLLIKAKTVLQENSMLLNDSKKMRQTTKAQYDPTVLNASMDPQKIVRMVQNAARFAEKHNASENGVRMLFYGLSGTGKTELARYISETLGRPLLLKRASDVLDCYVGGNEENIRTAFEEAEQTDSILLFDEADSFFSDRNKAKQSWERTMVNEFLTQMEEFSGILICTTNLRKIMDSAMQRRFHILVEFKPMKFDGIKKMAEKYFPDYQFSNKQLEELEEMESVTPGDFGALASRIRFMDFEDIDSAYILDELKKLQEEKLQQQEDEGYGGKRKIGFCA